MGTQLILTIGTNPLPVWVAWYHLKDKLPKPIKVRLVHTAGTVDERDRLQKYCPGADFLDPIQTSDGDPRNVRNDMRNIENGLSSETTLLHIHYTGGTKVMAVETVAALEATLPETIHLDTSYLDPRAAAGPAIVNRAGNTWVRDARKNVTADLARTALLNGFTIGPFHHEYWDKSSKSFETEECPPPATLSQEQLEAGRKALHSAKWDPYLLEYGAYASFKEALEKVSTSNPDRNNYKLSTAFTSGEPEPQIRGLSISNLTWSQYWGIRFSLFHALLILVMIGSNKKAWRLFYERGNSVVMKQEPSYCVALTQIPLNFLKMS